MSLPEDKACTERLQQWNIRGEGKNTDALKFQDLRFEKARLEKDTSTSKPRKRPVVCGKREYYVTPVFARDGTSPSKIKSLHDQLKETKHNNYLTTLLASNNYQKSNTFTTSVTMLSSSDADEPSHDEIRLHGMYDNFRCSYDESLVTEGKDVTFIRNHLTVDKNVLRQIEKQ